MRPDFIEHEAGPVQGRGLEGVKTIVTMMHIGFPDLHATIEDMTAEGDKTWARVTLRGTNTGAFMGMPPPGSESPLRPSTFAATLTVRWWNIGA